MVEGADRASALRVGLVDALEESGQSTARFVEAGAELLSCCLVVSGFGEDAEGGRPLAAVVGDRGAA